MKIRIAVAQVHPPTADIPAALRKLRWLLEGLQYAKADILVLPECWLTGYHLSPTLARALAVPFLNVNTTSAEANPLAAVAALAAEFRVAIVIGFIERSGEVVFNSLALFDRSGSVRGHYRKSHLWGPIERETYTYGPGPGVEAFVPVTLPEFPDVPIGLLICYDMEFPEPSRLLALAGAKLIIASTAMAEAEAFASRVYARARACENHIAFVFSNYPSSESPAPPSGLAGQVLAPPHYSGGSTVVGPDGSVIYALPAFACPGKDGKNKTQPGNASEHFEAEATATVLMVLRNSNGFSLGFDESLFVVSYDPCDKDYISDEERNPYLRQRRLDLYGK